LNSQVLIRFNLNIELIFSTLHDLQTSQIVLIRVKTQINTKIGLNATQPDDFTKTLSSSKFAMLVTTIAQDLGISEEQAFNELSKVKDIQIPKVKQKLSGGFSPTSVNTLVSIKRKSGSKSRSKSTKRRVPSGKKARKSKKWAQNRIYVASSKAISSRVVNSSRKQEVASAYQNTAKPENKQYVNNSMQDTKREKVWSNLQSQREPKSSTANNIYGQAVKSRRVRSKRARSNSFETYNSILGGPDTKQKLEDPSTSLAQTVANRKVYSSSVENQDPNIKKSVTYSLYPTNLDKSQYASNKLSSMYSKTYQKHNNMQSIHCGSATLSPPPACPHAEANLQVCQKLLESVIGSKIDEFSTEITQELKSVKNQFKNVQGLITEIHDLEKLCPKKRRKAHKLKSKSRSKYAQTISRECQKWINFKMNRSHAEQKLINCEKLKRISRFMRF